MSELVNLKVEWRNKSQADYMLEERPISMAALERELLALKDRETYFENWLRLASKEDERHAHDNSFVARLLYLVDERPIPISALQKSIGMQLGHLFRNFDRAGVVFRAHTSGLKSRLRSGYWPWPCEIYIDPTNGIILRHAVEIPLSDVLKIYHKDNGPEEDPEDSDPTEDDYIGLLEETGDVPLPVHPRFRTATVPPEYKSAFPPRVTP